jgi:hypothetical protein
MVMTMKKLNSAALRRLIREAMQFDYSAIHAAVSRLKTLRGFDLWEALEALEAIPSEELETMFGQSGAQHLADSLEKLAVMLSEVEYVLSDAGVIEPATY